MTNSEWHELLDLYIDNALPDVLRARVETYLTAQPAAAQDVATQQAALARLRAVPPERPEGWFVEHALDSLLRDHAGATPYDQHANETNR